MSYSDAGNAFIFGSLVGPKMDVLFDGAGFIFAFRVLPAIIFVTALISLLYYIGVMGLLIRYWQYFSESPQHQQNRIFCRSHHYFPRAK